MRTLDGHTGSVLSVTISCDDTTLALKTLAQRQNQRKQKKSGKCKLGLTTELPSEKHVRSLGEHTKTICIAFDLRNTRSYASQTTASAAAEIIRTRLES